MTKNDEYDSTQTPVIVWTDFHNNLPDSRVLPKINALTLIIDKFILKKSSVTKNKIRLYENKLVLCKRQI